VTRPAATYALRLPVKSLSLNQDGSRLAVNDMICKVVREEHGPELASWSTPAKGHVAQLVGQDEVWVVARQGGTFQMPKTKLWQLSPKRRVVIVPEPLAPEAQKLADRLTGTFGKSELHKALPVVSASTLGLLGPPSGHGPFLAASSLYPGRFHLFHVLARTQRWTIAQAGHLFFRKVGFVAAAFGPSGRIDHLVGVPMQMPVLELWDYHERKRLALSNELADCMQFSPDGRRVATDTEHGSYRIGTRPGLRLWNAATGEVDKVLPSEGADALKFSSDGRRLLAVKIGGKATLFDVEAGRELQTWKSSKKDWQTFALNPDGALVASGGEDEMIHLWDVASSSELARWQAHDAGVTALLFSKDGQTLYSGGQDGTLKLWNLSFLRKELRALHLDW
jgi:WD40 repeat protein